MTTLFQTATVGALWGIVTLSFATAEELKVGDRAPALTPSKWIKGEPVAKFETGKVYVVEFWATWCGPCRQSIPHLSLLQEKFKEAVIIGQNCSEEDQDAVAPFVKEMGNQMNYRVALDDVTTLKEGKMNTAWMEASGQNGIPTAFVVDQAGKLAWIGHPLNGLDRVLAAVVAGTFDAKKEAELAAQKEKLEGKLQAAMQAEDWDSTLKYSEELARLDPDMAPQLRNLKFVILLKKKDFAGAYAFAAKLGDENKDHAETLNELAWIIVDPDNKPAQQDLPLAEKLATRANELTKGETVSILDTLARVYFEKGELDKAILTQTKAAEKAQGREKNALQATLEEYKAEKTKKK